MSIAVQDKLKTILARFAGEIISKAAILDEEVEQALFRAFIEVPRHLFVDDALAHEAYLDGALPIDQGQLISKPSVVARMLSVVAPRRGSRVLEIGTGSGYSAALLSSMGAQVYGMEEQGLLAQKTRKRLDALGFHNVLIRPSSGDTGWAEYAPFDTICVWTPVTRVDAELFMQLASPGGRLIAPIGDHNSQTLHLWDMRDVGMKMTKLEKVSLIQGIVTDAP